MDNFHSYLKKQLVEYVEVERKKGIPLPEIEKVLLDAGHKKNIIDEVLYEIKKEHVDNKETNHKDPVEQDMVQMLKNAFNQFMSKATNKEISQAKKDIEKTDTDSVVEEVIDEVEIIEEKTMLESTTFFVYLVIITLIILVSAGGSNSDIVRVSMGYLAAIVSVFVSFLALSLANQVPLYMLIPLSFSTLFYAITKFTSFPLFRGYDAEGLAIVNFLIGFIFNVIIVYVRFVKPKHMKRREIKKKSRYNPNSHINTLRNM
jgi:hypothetical protein